MLVYNVLGVEIATLVDEKLGAGVYTFEWDGGRFASGIYYYRLQSDDFVEVKKFMLLR